MKKEDKNKTISELISNNEETPKVENHNFEKEINDLKAELGSTKKLLLDEKEKNLRVSAEMINFKRRKEDEISNMLKYANEDVIKSLLPIVDNFERAIKLDDNDLSDEVSKFLSGFKLMYGNLIGILEKLEVHEILCDGLEFNPVYHEAVITEKDENKPSGVILEVLQKGYIYKDKVIRPAMVKVNE